MTEESQDLLWNVKNGEVEMVKKLLQKSGVDVNAEIMGGRNALHFAADYGQTETIKVLCEKGADVNLPDKHGITPVLAAVWEGHVDAVKLLISKGACKTGNAPSGETYLQCAETDEMKIFLRETLKN